MKTASALFFLFIVIPSVVFSQTIVSGSVKNREGKPLSANVTVRIKGSAVVAGFAATGADGTFTVKFKGTGDSIVVTAAGINIGKHSRTVVFGSERADFVIDEKPIELKEVTVTTPKLKRTGDTIDYSVAAFTDQNDRVIGDALKKMPGIEVGDGGGIKINGKPINKFYVEDMDLLQGRYGLAVNNISVKDVVSVQVYENHQPIKALRDRSFSDNAAINLKLRESAKGTFAVTGMAGLGYSPVLWNAEAVAMYFGKKRQNMSAYKGNNSGNDVTGEFRTHYDYERVLVGFGSQLYVQSPSTPPVAAKRYLHNNIHAVTYNQLFKLNKDTELTANAQYYNDRQRKEGHSVYEQYFAGDSALVIEEKAELTSRINNAEFVMRINTNESSYHLNNVLGLRGSWNGDRGLGNTKSSGIDETVSQALDKPIYAVDNTLNIIKNVKQNSYNIYFSAGYASSPHTLTVTPALFDPTGENNSLSSLTQHVHSKDFASALRLSYGLRIGGFNLDYSVWGRADVKNMETSLVGNNNGIDAVFADSMKNNLFYNNYQVGFNQSYSYKSEKFKSSINIPLTYGIFAIDDRIPSKYTQYDKIIVNPSVSAGYDFLPELNVSASANFNKSYGDMGSAYTGYIMHGYRSFLRNTVDRMFETRAGGSGVSLNYRNVFNMLFINLGARYDKSWKNLLYGYNYQGIMSIKTTIDRPTEAQNRNITANIQKGLNFWSTTLRLSGGYGESAGEQLIQDEIIDYVSQSYSAGLNINTTPLSFAGLKYAVLWRRSKNSAVELPERFPPVETISQDIQINIFPTKTISLNIGAEHQFNSVVYDDNRHTFFADAGIKFKRKRLDLELECNNIFNSKRYISASYNDISSYYYSYDLRPLSILLRARFKLM